MSKKTFRVHRHCGGRVRGDAWCSRCRKWLVGDAIDVVHKKRTEKEK